MSTLMTRVNGVAVVVDAFRVRPDAPITYVGKADLPNVSTYQAPQLFTVVNLAAIDAMANGNENLATAICEEYGFVTITLADLVEITRFRDLLY